MNNLSPAPPVFKSTFSWARYLGILGLFKSVSMNMCMRVFEYVNVTSSVSH